jgi:hypothetical protein
MADVIDYKKKYRELYAPGPRPALIEVPPTNFIAIEGTGDPNEVDGEYQKALELLYAVQYTIKMSKKGNAVPAGYFDYVVPPLEGFWLFAGNVKTPPKDKSAFTWISMIRLPEYVDKKVFARACEEAAKKKKIDTGKLQFLTINEGLCVQCLHSGSYDNESATLKLIADYIDGNGLANDITEKRRHHEIYLSDPRKTEPAKLKTILRIPVKRK